MAKYVVRPGYTFGAYGTFREGDIVELPEADAQGFLDKLELVEGAPALVTEQAPPAPAAPPPAASVSSPAPEAPEAPEAPAPAPAKVAPPPAKPAAKAPAPAPAPADSAVPAKG